MEETAGWLTLMWAVIGIGGLALALVIGSAMWSRRRKGPVSEQRRDEATERVYRESERDEKRSL